VPRDLERGHSLPYGSAKNANRRRHGRLSGKKVSAHVVVLVDASRVEPRHPALVGEMEAADLVVARVLEPQVQHPIGLFVLGAAALGGFQAIRDIVGASCLVRHPLAFVPTQGRNDARVDVKVRRRGLDVVLGGLVGGQKPT